MEPEGSLPHSQKHATCPYFEPDQSSPRSPPPHPMTLLEDPFKYYPPIYAWIDNVSITHFF